MGRRPSPKPRESQQRLCTVQVACDGNALHGTMDVCHRCSERLEKRARLETKGLRGEKWAVSDEIRNATRVRLR